MRWEELGSLLPHGALHSLACTYPSVESFLVNRSKALAAAPAHVGSKGAWAAGGGAAGGGADACAGVDPAMLAAVEAVLDSCLAPQWRSGAQLMQELRHTIQVLPTGCAAVDALLGGGLREGTLVEVAGETASGKTQLCLSAAATTAYRGEAVMYIDTTGSFAPERVVQMAEAEAAASSGAWPQAPTDGALAGRVLGCISVLRPSHVYDLLGPLDRLGAALQQQQQQQQQKQQQQVAGLPQQQPPPPGVDGIAPQSTGGAAPGAHAGPRLLIIDSVSALLSTVLGNNQHTQGTTLLTTVGHTLKQLAEQHSIAVLVTNHVTSAGSLARGGRAGGGGGSGGDGGERGVSAAAALGVAGLKPALGEQWRSQPHMRVQLSIAEAQPPESGVRVATLTASPLQACGQKQEFRIVDTGLV